MRGVMVALDLETTGLDYSSARIIEVGAVKFTADEIVETYSTLVDPEGQIPAKITAITGIDSDKVRNAPKLRDVLPKLKQFVGDAPIIGHNVEFDLHFVQREGILKDNRSVDTYELASVLLPATPRYNLNALMQQLDVTPEGEHHRALADALGTARVYMAFWRTLLNDLPLDLLREIVQASQGLSWRGLPTFEDALKAREEGLGSGPKAVNLPFNAPRPDLNKPALQPSAAQKPLDADSLSIQLETVDGFESRPRQIEMLQAVTQAFNDHEHLMIEAAPGTGRSLAYLLPAITWAVQNNERVVLSVNTASLQTQILEREIPLLKKAFGLDFNAAVLKRRADYLCPRRLQEVRRRLPTSMEELRLFAKIQVLLHETQSDDCSPLSLRGPAEINAWTRLSAQDEECPLDCCEQRMNGTCPFYRARRQADSAHLLIVNHSLLISDAVIADPVRRVIPDYQHVILDEAHNLEDAITNSLDFRLDSIWIKQQLADLGTTKTGLLGDVLGSTQPIVTEKIYERIKAYVAIIIDAAAKMSHHIDGLFAALMAFLQSGSNMHSDYMIQVRLTYELRNKPAFSQVKAAWAILSQFTDGIAQAMTQLSKGLAGLQRFEIPNLADLVDSTNAASQHLLAIHKQLNAFIAEPDENTIYWIEVSQDMDLISIHGAPLNVGPLIQKHLWGDKQTVIMVSPTMRTSNNFEYMKHRLQADAVQELAVISAFNYEKSTLVYLPTDMPEPQDRNRYQQYIERGIIELATATDGRLLALFTGYTQLRQAAQNIAPRLALGNIAVFDQSDGTSRQALLEGFRNNKRSVLLGTRSLWEDVDLPVDVVALVIVRLPFAVPSDPVFAARSETFDDPFNQFTVPDAILRFRQGFDRLGRVRKDRGIVAIFDKRMISKEYGQTFLESLPIVTMRRSPMSELGSTAKTWLSEQITEQADH
jgi:ATP-dependent DNA helicase DinG